MTGIGVRLVWTEYNGYMLTDEDLLIRARAEGLARAIDGGDLKYIQVTVTPRAAVYQVTCSVCNEALLLSIPKTVMKAMPGDLLERLVEFAIDYAREPDEEKRIPADIRSWVYNEAYKYTDNPVRKGLYAPAYHSMPPKQIEALKLLKRSGLLDDLPPHTMFTNMTAYTSPIDRTVHIGTAPFDTTLGVEAIANVIYNDMLPNIVGYAMNARGCEGESYADLRTEMEYYGKQAIEYTMAEEE